MKRKVNAGNLRLSPNEEASILKEDYERRRKLRLLQVREQEKDIALQIRKDVKQRRHQHFTRLAEELRAEWEESQTQKIQNLEKLYLASLRNMGEGHRQAKENEPDLDALARRTAERKRKAEVRHKEALKLQKNQKEILMKQKSWPIKARKEALLVEKERSAKITSRPLPPPALFENIEVKRISSVKTNSSTYHHISTFVNREMVTTQPDAHLAAEEEAKRLEELQRQAAQERVEQFQKAHVRGFQAMKRIHLAQGLPKIKKPSPNEKIFKTLQRTNQEKLMKELKQLQQEDLARRRQTVAQMPPQLVELPYKRSEMKEDWQRELEFAFEDMYNADRKVKGNLILHLEPEPLPAVTDQIQDEELDLSMEQESTGETVNHQVKEAEMICSSETDVPLAVKTQQLPSKILFKKLLNRIRSQKSLWTIKSMSEDESENITTVSEIESKSPTVESGTISSEERPLFSEQEQVAETDTLTIESGLLTSEDIPPSCQTDSGKEQEISDTPPATTLAQSSVLLHPQEEALRVRMSARQKQIMEIEEQKQKQLELLEQIEQQKLRLETDCFRAKLEEEKRKKVHWTGVRTAPVPCTVISDEDSHRQMIHNYQQQLLQQNRLHRQTVETARKRLLEYQTILKGRYPSASATSLISDSIISVPREFEKSATLSEHWDQSQRLKLSPNKYQHMQSIQISKLEQDHIQVPRLSHFPQRQVETTEALMTSDVLAKQSLESQEHLKQFFQTETQQSHYKSVPKDSHILLKPLSHDRPPLILQDAGKIPETLRATTFQALDSQQILSENSENISSKLTEPASFQPLVPQRSFTMLPFKVESGKIQEPFSTVSKNAVSMYHSIYHQMHGGPLPSSETITAQQGNLKALQEQLELQKEVLQARQEAQKQLLWNRQKELKEQTGLSVFLPVRAPDSFISPPSAKTELRIQESFPSKNATAVSSSDSMIPQLPDRPLSSSQPVLPQQSNFNFLQEQLNIQRDSLQARREAQEVLIVQKQNELDGRVLSEQAQPSSLPHQITQHTFTLLPFGDRQPGKLQEQQLSTSDTGPLSTQSETFRSQDGSMKFLHDSSTLLQKHLTTQKDTLQPRHGTQVSFSQHSNTLQALGKAAPKNFQKLYLSEETNTIPSIIPTFQDKSLTFSPHGLPKQENLTVQGQSHIQRVILGASQETQEPGYTQSELEKRSTSEQTGTSLSQVAESERFQDLMSSKSDSTVPFSHSKIPGLQEGLLRFSQQTLPPQDNLNEHQEWLNTEKEDFDLSQKLQDSTSQQTGLSSFIPQLGQLSFTSLPSADSSTTQELLSTESDSKIPSSHIQIPELQDRLLKISQLIQPQQDNLKAIQEQLATQREAILQSRQEAQKEILLHKHSRWKGGTSSEQMSTSSSPLEAQHSFALLPPTESEKTQEFCPTNSDSTSSSTHSEMQRLPDRLWGLSPPVLSQQDNLTVLQEHLHVQKNSFSSLEKTQKELVLPRQRKPEEEISSEHFIHPHHGDLKALQQQLDIQRKTIRSEQEVQEELLLQRLSKLEERVSSEQISSSSSYPQAILPAADSERTQKAFPARSHDTDTLSSQDRILSFSQPSLPQQDNLTAHLDLEREVGYSNDKPQEEWILNRQSQLNKSESAQHASPFLFSSKEIEHSFIPLPFAEAKSKSVCELYSSETGDSPPSSDSMILRFQDRLSSGSQPILGQQENLGFQNQLNLQREILRCSQKAQKELLEQRQTALQQQIQKHQETLKDFFKDSQASKPTVESDLKMQKIEQFREWLPHIQDLARGDQNRISHADGSNSDDTQLLSEDVSAKQSGEHLDKQPGRRASKPPVAKVKYGLDVNQHELSVIQEVESPASGRTSIPGKTDAFQDRDPMRVSVSREQSFLGSPLAHDPIAGLQQVPQEPVCGEDCDEAGKAQESDAENHAVLSYAAGEEEYTHLSPTIEPDNKAETQETFHEPLSSVTLSTGSLSYENTDLSLSDPESFSESMDQLEQESTTGREEEADILSFVVPSTEVIYQLENSSDVCKSLLPAVEEFTSGHTHTKQTIDKYKNEANLTPEKADLRVDLDFPELEHIFPNLHRQLFKPLEPHPDFDLSSSSSVISQDNRNLYQNSDSSSERHCAAESKSRGSFIAPKRTSLHSFFNTSLNQQPNPNMVQAVGQSFATDSIIEGSEQSFQQLLQEFSSPEGSQHADLPSICSIEARDYSQGMENQNYSSQEQTEISQKKKSVHFQLSVGNLSSAYSSFGEPNVFSQLVQHSTPCASSSEHLIKQEKEKGRETLDFEELSKGEVVTVSHGQGLTENDKNETCRDLDVNPHAEEMDSQLCVRTVEMGTSENCFENSSKTEAPKIITPSQVAQPEPSINSESFSLQSCIPIWETESGHGIMEEPELTLVSTSDISITETDIANLMLEEKGEDGVKSYLQESEFLPLVGETEETLDYSILSEPPMQKLKEPTAMPESLQEAFVKRKKLFMERSYQRQKEIKNKTLNSLTKTVKDKQSTDIETFKSLSDLSETSLKTNLSKERQTTQSLMHQRALRLYNQLAEVKQQKEEKAKQEAYAQNRARAKEFHKKTLEKLRAKNAC